MHVLYYLVPVAEEEDLLDEVRRERAQKEWDFNPWVKEESSDWDVVGIDESPEESPVHTLAQILGLLQHLLGAEVISLDEEED